MRSTIGRGICVGDGEGVNVTVGVSVIVWLGVTVRVNDAVAVGVDVSVRVGVHVGGSVDCSATDEVSVVEGNMAIVGRISISGSLDVPQAVINNTLINRLTTKR